jgi:NAD(P)-dependent dehydrogenase (short-subunit alcohol dehydrogenase family)
MGETYGSQCHQRIPGHRPRGARDGEDWPQLRGQYLVAAVTPLRRLGEVMDVAYGVLFLTSDEASFITGTEPVIDGGFIAQ